MAEAYIYDCVRTPRGKGKKNGALHEVTPTELLAQMLKAIQQRNNLDTSLVEDVVIGCVTPIGDQGGNIAKTAVMMADYDYFRTRISIEPFLRIRFGSSKLSSYESAFRMARLSDCRWRGIYVARTDGLRWRRLGIGYACKQSYRFHSSRYQCRFNCDTGRFLTEKIAITMLCVHRNWLA
jgi:hypothetical protein